MRRTDPKTVLEKAQAFINTYYNQLYNEILKKIPLGCTAHARHDAISHFLWSIKLLDVISANHFLKDEEVIMYENKGLRILGNPKSLVDEVLKNPHLFKAFLICASSRFLGRMPKHNNERYQDLNRGIMYCSNASKDAEAWMEKEIDQDNLAVARIMSKGLLEQGSKQNKFCDWLTEKGSTPADQKALAVIVLAITQTISIAEGARLFDTTKAPILTG